ncbi:MAG: transcription antitermination factor NusB [Polyangiaceae bacterium]
MGARTGGREAALQMLYALDSVRAEGETVDSEQLIHDYWREVPGDPEGRDFADGLFRGVVAELDAIDERIRSASKHWRLERMSRVDRNVLRLGVQELSQSNDVPRAVIIDEAVELAKRFGAEGSSVFVNGVLDRIAEDLGRS